MLCLSIDLWGQGLVPEPPWGIEPWRTISAALMVLTAAQ